MEGPGWIVITMDGRHRGLSHHQDCFCKQVSVSMIRGIDEFYCRLFIVAIRAFPRSSPVSSTSDSRMNGGLWWKVAMTFGRPMMDGGYGGWWWPGKWKLVKTEVGQDGRLVKTGGQEVVKMDDSQDR